MLINKTFGCFSDSASVNFKNAHFLMGGIKVRESPHAGFTRFEWTMPFSLPTEVIMTIVQSHLFGNSSLFAMRLSDLRNENTFQVVPNRDFRRDHKDVDAVEVHNLVARSDKGQQCKILGASLKITTGMLYILDTAKVETTGDLPPKNSLANSLFFDTHLVMFQGASSALVQFSGSKGMMSPQLTAINPAAPWPKATKEIQEPNERSLMVDVAATKDEILLNVQVVVSLLGHWSSWETLDCISPSESLHRVTFADEGSSALAHEIYLAGVRTKQLVPNPILCTSLLASQQVERDEEEPDLVKTTEAGRTSDCTKKVHEVMDAQKKLAAEGMSTAERVDLLAADPPPPSRKHSQPRLLPPRNPSLLPPKTFRACTSSRTFLRPWGLKHSSILSTNRRLNGTRPQNDIGVTLGTSLIASGIL